MPALKNRVILGLGKNVRLSINLEAELTGVGTVLKRFGEFLGVKAGTSKGPVASPRSTQAGQIRTVKNQRLGPAGDGVGEERIEPGKIVWIFGTGRSGSTWLGSMMGDYEGNALWHEPYVGELFGTAYYVRAWEKQRDREGFIMSRPYKGVWLKSIRNFVLDGASARFPDVEGHLIIKEPHGSVASPLLIEALPESRMVFLVRDPRDVAASRLDAHRKGSWTSKITGNDQETLADRDPDAFAKAAARMYLRDMEKAKQAYDEFGGHKSLVRYEDLRYDALGELKRVYSELDIAVDEARLRQVVEKHAWENIPENRKGLGKSHRKATPGGWREDLTPGQIEGVERITAPMLEAFYPG